MADSRVSSPAVSLIERRSHLRVGVELRCYTTGASPLLVGLTVNISRTGLLVRWQVGKGHSQPPQVGDSLKLDLELPASSVGRKCIRCRGRVVRVSVADRRLPLIAVAVAQMEFRDHAPEPVTLRWIEGGRSQKKRDLEAAL